ncbi:MAG: hypothetical protein ABJK36_07320 [Tateyamaria sp.]|uniref:hypothetical protein n=1 Tax=Tateyamaria sp. TaxID=1929288 RepID=UPI00329C1495
MFIVSPDGSLNASTAPTRSFRNSPVVLVAFAGNCLTREATRAYRQSLALA